MQSLLGSLNTKYQRIDVTLIDLEQAMTQQTSILEHQQTLLAQIAGILVRHEETFAALQRLLDQRLPPTADNGH